MASWSLALGLACLVISVVGFPARGQDPYARLNNGMMVRGYFLRSQNENLYYPRAAYGIGMAGVGTYYAPRRNSGGCRNCNQVEDDLPMAVPEPEAESDPRDEAPEDLPVENVTDVNLPGGDMKPEVEAPKEEETPVPTNAPRPKTPKKSRTPKRRPIDVDDDEEEEEVPRKGGRKGDSPSYSNFFPINFGGGAGRSAQGQDQEDGQNPGLIAIANSFSTGRGAIAASHATANGGPASTRQATRGSPSRYRS